ncbi:MAG: site-specific integrase [Castellaniella sp.]
MQAAIQSPEQAGSIHFQLDTINTLLHELYPAAYSRHTLEKRRWVLSTFARWATNEGLTLNHLDDAVVNVFLSRLPNAPADRIQLERGVIQRLLRHLRTHGIGLPSRSGACLGASEGLHADFVAYLRDERGLAENSIQVYGPYVLQYLKAQDLGHGQFAANAFDVTTMREHMLTMAGVKSSEVTRLTGVALRAFCRFLFLRGKTPADMSGSIPSVKKWRQSAVPAFITAEQLSVILAAIDRATFSGARDYAILLLLAHLGLRASEVVFLMLEDILWRKGELIIHGKGGMIEHAPLLSEVGEALACYLRHARPGSTSRRVFLRTYAPHVGFTGPAAIGHIVRRAFVRAGFHPASRGAAHLFRHGLATTMIRQGATMPQIAQVLRHRSEDSTAIYAKVAFETLRTVARPWPTTEVSS